MGNLPSGIVTFLFTDIEGSTKLAQSLADKWESLRARHHKILKSAIESNNGYVFQKIGDAFCASFHTAGGAIRAAVQAQINFYNEDWGATSVKVRMGINTGNAEPNNDTDHSGGYKGYITMARVQRIMSAGHGGQVLISHATEELVHDDLPENVSLRDLGECRLKDLIRPERIHQLVISGLPTEFPPLKTLDVHRHNLPVQLNSFIGREKEIADLVGMIKDHRLVTLTGIGGTGKTRLSLQVSADLIDEYSDGVWLVQLAPLTDAALVPQEVASTWQIENQSGQSLSKTLSDYVRNKKMLLIMDNCEHVLEACASLSSDLLHVAPNIKILATSRIRLNVEGEVIYPVHPLAFPDPEQNLPLPALTQYEAVRLFIERAVSVRPTFRMTNDNAYAVVHICQRLDGIPLAIELAAARIRALSPDQIAERLKNRFDLLTGGSCTILPRQQTLRATMDWSYELLTENERDLLNQLSVFAGDFSLDAVERIGLHREESRVGILDLLTALVDNSLIIVNEKYSESRYQLLETVRQYADENLAEAGKNNILRDRHLDYFLELAETAELRIISFDQLQWLAKLDEEYENLRAALQHSLSKGQKIQSGLKLAKALTEYWQFRSYFDEQLYWQKIALDKSQSYGRTPVRAKLLYEYGLINSTIRGKQKESQPLLEESLQIFQSLGKEYLSDYAYVLVYLGYRKYWEDHDTGIAMMQEAIQIFEEIDDKQGHGWALNLFSDIKLLEESIQSAFETSKKGASLYLEIGNRYGYAICIGNLGYYCLLQSQYQEARKHFEEATGIFKEFKNKGFGCQAVYGLGEAYRGLNKYEKAEAHYRESLIMRQEAGMASGWLIEVYIALGYSVLHQNKKQQAITYFKDALELSRNLNYPASLVHCLASFAADFALQGNGKESALLFGAVNAHVQSLIAEGENLNSLIEPIDQKEFEYFQALCRSQLGSNKFDDEMENGRGLTLDEAIAFALEMLNE